MSALKTPSFWYRKSDEPESVTEKALSPVAKLYEMLYRAHQASKQAYKAEIPVLCIGNIVAGGTGKTPTSVALMKLIKAHGLARNPHFLLRGYGGSESGPVLVDPLMHSAWEVGDEALILNNCASTIVSNDRAAGTRFAHRRGADLILMDDGLQNPGIEKNLKLIVINGEMGFGNEKLLPAGPLRQPLIEGLKKADAYIIIGKDERNVLAELPTDKPVIRANLKPTAEATFDKGAKYLAFAGLGYPDKFFNFLKNEVGLNIVETMRFADHCPYGEAEMRLIKAKAKAADARLITTEKDSLRLPKSEDTPIDVLPIEMFFEQEEQVIDLLKSVIAPFSQNKPSV